MGKSGSDRCSERNFGFPFQPPKYTAIIYGNLQCAVRTPDTGDMQPYSGSEPYLAVPVATWETNKRPYDEQGAPEIVSNSSKRSCTPENTFSSKYLAVSDSNYDAFTGDAAVETALPPPDAIAESKLPCRTLPGVDKTESPVASRSTAVEKPSLESQLNACLGFVSLTT